MFTGIIERAGTVRAVVPEDGRRRITVEAGSLAHGVEVGDSVAVNGVCLTAVALAGEALAFDVIPETLDRSNLGALTPGARVNLERPLMIGARLDGHFVQGHVDTTGTVTACDAARDGEVRLTIGAPPAFMALCIPKGSVAVDGVSLTIAALHTEAFTVALIPHTLAVTTLGDARSGTRLNLEADMLGKYVLRLLQNLPGATSPGATSPATAATPER